MGKKPKKEDVRREMDKWMDEMVETGKLQIKGGYGKPDWRNLICVQLFLLPYTLFLWFQWRHGLKKRRAENSLTHEDEIYLTYTAFGHDKDWWGALNQQDPGTAADMLTARVWEGNNLETYL